MGNISEGTSRHIYDDLWEDRPSNFDFEAYGPGRIVTEIRFTLLAQKLNMVGKPDSEYGLVVWRRCPVKVVNWFGCTSYSNEDMPGKVKMRAHQKII